MPIRAEPTPDDPTTLRTRYRAECGGQIVHDSIHQRDGWVKTYLLMIDSWVVGFGSMAIAGPWKDKPTVYELYILPEYRHRAFALFEEFLTASKAQYFEVQSSDVLLTVMLHIYGRNITSESIVFNDQRTTTLPDLGTRLVSRTSRDEILECSERRQGGGEWELELDGEIVASGGVLFHYNRPYGDIYMEVKEAFRQHGFGAFLVQELKRQTYQLGAIPCARCNPKNIASRKTLQKAGFVPFAHILNGTI